MNSQSSESERHENAGDKHSPVIKPETPHKIGGAKPTKKKTKQPRDAAYWEKRQFRVQRLIAFAGVIGLIIYGLQLWEMRKSTDAATTAAQAAKDSIKLATENAHLEQRAWVGVTTIDGTLVVDQPYKVDIVFKNTGRSFANEVIIRMGVQRLPISMTPDFSKVEAEAKGTSNGILAPDSSCHGALETTVPISDEEMKEIEAHLKIVYVHGTLTYVDVFQCKHWTSFCYVVRGNRSSGWHHDACESRNESDNNCGPKTP